MAIDRVNFYLQQIVSEAHLDGAFDDVEDALKNTALDGHLKQAKTTDSPDMTVFGGIVSGLTVTDLGGQTAQVALGTARDHLGRRINLPANATVLYTNAGSTPQGDSTAALGDGASIAASCPAGQYIIVSLFIVFDQYIHTDVIDGAGTPLKYNYDQSFHFDLQVGVAGSPAPSRASLSDSKVLLADLLLLNNGGTLEVVANGICYSDENWDTLAALHADYANFTGRRSDWIALEGTTNFPQFATKNTNIRRTSNRAAIHELVRMLQVQASDPSGAGLIGSRTYAPSTNPTVSGYFWPLWMTTLAADSVEAQVRQVIDTLNNGFGSYRRPHIFFDDFFYPQGVTETQDVFSDLHSPWVSTLLGGASWVTSSLLPGAGADGGAVRFSINAANGHGIRIRTAKAWWNIGASPWACASCRFMLLDQANNELNHRFHFGFEVAVGSSHARARYNSATGNMVTECAGASGVNGVATVIGAVTKGVWRTLRMAWKSATEFYFQLDGELAVVGATDGGSAFDNNAYFLEVEDATSAAEAKYLDVDQAMAGDLSLALDML